MARKAEDDFGQSELQRAAPEQVQRIRLRRRLALRPGLGPADQAEQVLHSRHPQVWIIR